MINLLPWREKARRTKQKQVTLMMSLSAVFGVLLGGVGYIYLDRVVTAKRESVALLNYPSDAEKKKWITRIHVLRELRAKQVLTTLMPDEVFLTHLQRHHQLFIVQGIATSTAAISVLMQNITQSHWIQHPILTEIKPDKTIGSRFELRFSMRGA